MLYSKFLCHVFRRAVSLSIVLQHCCLEEDPSRPRVSFPWAVLCVMEFLSLVLVGHSTGKRHETMKRRQVHHTSTSNDFHVALFVDEYQRPSIDVCTIGNSPMLQTNLPNPVQYRGSKLSHKTMKRRQVYDTSTSNDFHEALFVDAAYQRPSSDVCTIGNSPKLHTNLPNPHSLLAVSCRNKKLSKLLNVLVREERTLTSERPAWSPSMPLYGTLFCLEPVFPVAMRIHESRSAVTSALANPIYSKSCLKRPPV